VFAAHFLGEANLIEARAAGTTEMVALDGLRLYAGPPPDGEERGVVVIRPELIRINSGRPLDNVVRGTVDDVLYVGHATRVTVTAGPHRFLAYVSGADAQGPPMAGEEVSVGWNADDSVVVRADQDIPTGSLSARRQEGSHAVIG
jgi:ABC-type Fe3+/spermidine/putrescine transport system ATPase subunit